MADRYSDIMRAAQLKKAYDNYMKYLLGETDRQANIGQGTARPALKTLYVVPFGTKLMTNQFAQVSGTETFWTTHKTKFATRTKDSLKTDTPVEAGLKLRGFSPARISYKSGINEKGEVKTSNVTKMKYLSYGGKSQSIPFGTKDGTEAEETAYKALASQFTVDKNNKTYWQREKY